MSQPYAPGYAGPSGVILPNVVQERSPITVILLGIVTCGIYSLYWIYKTEDELRTALQDDSINPALDLLLVLVTFGFWSIYCYYRNAQKIYRALMARDPSRQDQSQTLLILNIATYFVGITHFVAVYIMQEELNALARASR